MSKVGIIVGFFLVLAAFAGLLVTYNTAKPSQQKTTVSSQTKPLTSVTVQLSWFHTAEFAGFYIGQDNGFYRQNGLDVTLLEAQPPTPPADGVTAGKAQFGVTGIDGILLARQSGNPMVALAAIYQESPVTFITFKDSGITKPQEFIGKRVTIECGSNAEYPQRAVLSKLNIARDQIIENCSTYKIDQLLNNETDVFAGFVTNEPILLELMGRPVNNILVTDYGVNFYANLIFTGEKLLAENPQLVRDFVTATVRGYEYALDHPEEAVTATLKRESGLGELDPEHQRRTMAVQTPLIFTGKTPVGWMEDAIWQQGTQILLDQGIVQAPVDYRAAYTNQFIK